MSLRTPLIYVFCAMVLLTPSLHAHPNWTETYCVGVIESDSVFDCSVKFDVPPYYCGKLPKESSTKELDEFMFESGRLEATENKARDNFLHGLRIYADGVPIPLELVSFPTAADVRAQFTKQGEDDRYPVLMDAHFRAKIPSDTANFEIIFPKELGPVLTNLRMGIESRVLMSVPAGEKGKFKIGEVHFTLSGFLIDGFWHVIPEGWDHCLFMVAMVLAAATVTEALKRSLIFTVGHAITLTLVVTATLPPVTVWIEPIIASTIAAGGYLAYRQKPAKTAYFLLPLVFGLIHGLGFAAAAADKLQDLSKADICKLLVGFNLGVEGAQICIILATAGFIFAFSKIQPETNQLRRALGLIIAILGTVIMLARTWSLLKGASL